MRSARHVESEIELGGEYAYGELTRKVSPSACTSCDARRGVETCPCRRGGGGEGDGDMTCRPAKLESGDDMRWLGCGDSGGEGRDSDTAGAGVRPRTVGTCTISSVSNVRASTTCSREVC